MDFDSLTTIRSKDQTKNDNLQIKIGDSVDQPLITFQNQIAKIRLD